MQTETYRSKIDTWLAALLLVPAILVLASVGIAVLSGAISAVPGLAILAISVALPVWLLAGTCYTLADEDLLVRCGPFRWRVPLAEITSMTPTRNPLSSPALSLERLRIDYGRSRMIMISPTDRDAFIRAVEARRARAV